MYVLQSISPHLSATGKDRPHSIGLYYWTVDMSVYRVPSCHRMVALRRGVKLVFAENINSTQPSRQPGRVANLLTYFVVCRSRC